MRSAPWLCLAVVFLVAGTQASPAHARSGRGDASRRLVLKQADGTVPTFLGYGRTESDARQHALEQAREWLAEKGGLDWTPAADYLLQKGLVRFLAPTEEEWKQAQDLKITGPMKVVKMELAVTAAQAEDVQQVARVQRMKQRQGVLARLLAGLVALLLVAGGYLRLEEATRGYYTTLLRTAALVVLALVGAGLWLLT
jgi:hypothetical protein